jgi:hypothetical protein
VRRYEGRGTYREDGKLVSPVPAEVVVDPREEAGFGDAEEEAGCHDASPPGSESYRPSIPPENEALEEDVGEGFEHGGRDEEDGEVQL